MTTPLMWVKVLTVSAALFALPVVMRAQIDRGTIQGVVTDQSGLGIPAAKVQVIQMDTNSALDLETNMEGLYTVGEKKMPLYVNRGIGTSNLPIRFFCRPEITVFHLS